MIERNVCAEQQTKAICHNPLLSRSKDPDRDLLNTPKCAEQLTVTLSKPMFCLTSPRGCSCFWFRGNLSVSESCPRWRIQGVPALSHCHTPLFILTLGVLMAQELLWSWFGFLPPLFSLPSIPTPAAAPRVIYELLHSEICISGACQH